MDVFGIVYHYYDGQLAGLVKPIVDSMSRTLKSVHTSEDEIVRLALEASGEVTQAATAEGEEASTAADLNAPRLTMGTALFELYLCLQQFQKYVRTLTAHLCAFMAHSLLRNIFYKIIGNLGFTRL